MALISSNNPNLDSILDNAYESYVDRLWEEAYGDHGERCYNCYHFEEGYKGSPCYCGREEATDEEIENDDYSAYVVDPDDCCEHWQPNVQYDDPEDEE